MSLGLCTLHAYDIRMRHMAWVSTTRNNLALIGDELRGPGPMLWWPIVVARYSVQTYTHSSIVLGLALLEGRSGRNRWEEGYSRNPPCLVEVLQKPQ